MFSRLFKTPKSSLQLFRENQAAMLPNDVKSPQVPSETFSSLPIIRKVGLNCGNREVPAIGTLRGVGGEAFLPYPIAGVRAGVRDSVAPGPGRPLPRHAQAL